MNIERSHVRCRLRGLALLALLALLAPAACEAPGARDAAEPQAEVDASTETSPPASTQAPGPEPAAPPSEPGAPEIPEREPVPKATHAVAGHVMTSARDAELFARVVTDIALRMRLYLTDHLGSSMFDSCPQSQPQDPGDGHFCLKQDLLPGSVFPEIFNEYVQGETFDVREVYPHAQHPSSDADAWEREVLARFVSGRVGQDAEFGEIAEWRGGRAYRYARPLLIEAPCLRCHGGPAGERDPYMPWHRKEGYRAGDVGGIVTTSVQFDER